MRRWRWLSGAAKLALGLSAMVSLGASQGGCASERDPINRVQPNAIPKSYFVRADANGAYLADSDSWFMRFTITDVPASHRAAFIGAASEMSRVKWRIEETRLVAYREDPDILGAGEDKGGILAEYPIVSHFDIRREYNPGTGEELNIVGENPVDRPWYQREYMRVDWSQGQGAWVQDKDDPNHPEFTPSYIDFTRQLTFQPDIQTCYYLYRDFGCTNGDVTIRTSFMKVPQRDYIPRDYPDRLPILDDSGDPIRTKDGTPVSLPMMDQFGYFRTERAVYDPRFGTLEKRYIYRANQWNLWEQWFERDEKGNVLKDEKGNPLLLPYRERKVRPIVYFLNPEFPAELRPTAQRVADNFNDAFSETVASLRLLEAKGRDGAVTQAELRAEVDAMRARGELTYVLCANNPVKQGDHPACGEPGTVARNGDLRYSFMHWVPKPQPAGPLGFGPSYTDPITGEIFSAGAFIYGAAVDTYAQNAVDIVNLLTGRFGEFDYINGVHTDAYAKRLARGEVPGPSASAREAVENASTPGSANFRLSAAKALVDRSVNRSLLKTIAAKGLPVATGPSGKDRIAMIQGTPLARKILDNPETRLLASKAPDQALGDDDLKKIIDAFAAGDLVKKENERLSWLGTHGCFFEANFLDDSIVGLAQELARKYPKSDDPRTDETNQLAMWNELRAAILDGVLAHEVGHTVGLRHNFEGSSDALNFFDRFWELKAGAKFGDPLTDAQKNGRMYEYQYSTIMDYGGRFNSDIHGLGKYDYAAIRFGYGNLVEAFPTGRVKDPLYRAMPSDLNANLTSGYSAEVLDRVTRNYRHYTQLPDMFEGGAAAFTAAGREIRTFESVVERARDLYIASGGSPDTIKTGSARRDNPLAVDVVPYRYCGDEFAGSADRPLCQRWDAGMDAFEVVQDAMTRYRQYYVFDAFTRGRVNGINLVQGHLGRLIQRYFLHVHSQYIYWLFFQGQRDYLWRQILNENDRGYVGEKDWFKDPGGGLPSTLATTWGLDRLVDVLATPDVGVFLKNDSGIFERAAATPFACRTARGERQRCSSNEDQLVMDIADGARYGYTQYASGTGQGFINRIKSVGSFYDKIAALVTLTNSQTNFVGTDTSNAIQYRIGFYLAFPQIMSSVFGGVVSDRYDNFAWRYEYDTTGNVKLMSVDPFQAAGIDDRAPAELAKLRGTAIDSGWFFFYKAYALLFSMAEFQSNYSQSWNDAVRVFCLGCGESFTPGAGVTTVSFTDPFSGKQYAAVKYGDGRFSPGADLVTRGQEFIDKLEAEKQLPTTDPDRDAKIARATFDLQNHIELIDLVRGLYATFGYSRL